MKPQVPEHGPQRKRELDAIVEGAEKAPELASRVEKRPELETKQRPKLPAPHVDPIDTYKKPVEMEEEIRRNALTAGVAPLPCIYRTGCQEADKCAKAEHCTAPVGDDFSGCRPPMRHIAGVNEETLRRAAGASGLSDFIRNATPAEKEKVYSEVMDKVVEQQRAVIAAAGVALGEDGLCKSCGYAPWCHKNGRCYRSMQPLTAGVTLDDLKSAYQRGYMDGVAKGRRENEASTR